MWTFYLLLSATAIRWCLYFPLTSTVRVVFMLLSEPPTYAEVFSPSPAPHCSILSLPTCAFPTPSPQIHFIAFLLQPSVQNPTGSNQLFGRRRAGWICAGLLAPLVPAPRFWAASGWPLGWLVLTTEQQCQTGKYWSVTGAEETVSMDRDVWSLCAQNWTGNAQLTQTHTLQTHKKDQTKRANPSMPQFWSSGLNMLLPTQAGNMFKNQNHRGGEAPNPGDRMKAPGRWERDSGKSGLLKCKTELVADEMK